MTRYRLLCASLLTVLSASGCVVGPKYRAPTADVPHGFDVGPAAPPTTAPSATAPTPRPVDLTRWWHSLEDSELDSLVDRAVKNNLDLRIALARLQQARAAEYVVGGATLPLVDLAAAAGRGSGSNSIKGRVPVPLNAGADTSQFREITHIAGFDANWEVDLFGRFAHQVEFARAQSQAAYEARNDVLISVVAEVARAYVQTRALQVRLDVADQNIRTQRQTVALVQDRFNRGFTNELDLALARRQLATVEAAVPPLQAALTTSQRRLAVLLGEPPQNLYRELHHPQSLPSAPHKIEPGLPLDLLRRRPDIRQAERQLAAATARLGLATSNLYPRVVFAAGAGLQGQGIGITPVKNALDWNLGPALYWPLLDFGTLDAIIRVEDFRTQEALYSYRRAILDAVAEVDDAIGNYTAQRDRLDRLNDALAASRRAVDLATQRYERGLTEFLNVLDAQRQLYAIQDDYAVGQQAVVLQFIAVYKSLGGGWERYQSVPAIPRPQPAVIAAGAQLLGSAQTVRPHDPR